MPQHSSICTCMNSGLNTLWHWGHSSTGFCFNSAGRRDEEFDNELEPEPEPELELELEPECEPEPE